MIIKQVDIDYQSIANCWIIVDEKSGEAAVVDPGAFDERTNTEELIASLGCKVKYILLTHGHFDHTLGVYGIREKYGAKVVINDEDAMMLADTALSLAQDNNVSHLQRPVKVDVRVKDGDILCLGDTEIKVIHTPGHTRGSVCYVIESEKTILSGDTLFCMTVGRTDFPGGSTQELENSLKKLLALEGDYRILPGHNRETTLDSERVRNFFIRRM